MKNRELINQSEVELANKLFTLKKELFDSKIKNKIGQLANPMSIRLLRRSVAQVSTVLSNKKRGSNDK